VLINLFFTGQNYIKKLRRENEQLKREIWNLREEYERLENYVKSREQSENEEVKLYFYALNIILRVDKIVKPCSFGDLMSN